MDAYGASFIGLPFPAITINNHLGWTHTVNPMDGADLYRLKLTENGYAWNEGSRAFESETELLPVRQPDGTLRVDTLVVRRSVHGPVIAQQGGEALAVRIVGLEESRLTEQYWQMLRATSLAEFEDALQRLQMPMFNTIYADQAGNILYQFGGQTPIRPHGDWSYWQGVVPGDTAATLWTRTHPYSDLPRIAPPKRMGPERERPSFHRDHSTRHCPR